MTTDFNLTRDLINELDGWVNKLAAPLLPPHLVGVKPDLIRPEFRKHIPHTVMIGKCVRAVSGIHAALALADFGYVAECAAMMRIVSDFCTEITAIGAALDSGGELPSAVHTLVEQYFVPKPQTLAQFKATKRPRYPSREELLKEEVRLAQKAGIDGDEIRDRHRFINSIFDAYVHGAYETTIELYDPRTGRFRMRGHSSPSKRREYIEWMPLKLHEVVRAVELTAAVIGHGEIFNAARDARHAMDKTNSWKPS